MSSECESLTSLHRAPLQKLLLDAATEAGADIQVNTRIIEIDESGLSPVAVTKDGRRIEADLIISADGEFPSPFLSARNQPNSRRQIYASKPSTPQYSTEQFY
jgi:2-polyprenyl-6-methoxyphenol hydroxylase-like FAD-dependent oxidoreductase